MIKAVVKTLSVASLTFGALQAMEDVSFLKAFSGAVLVLAVLYLTSTLVTDSDNEWHISSPDAYVSSYGCTSCLRGSLPYLQGERSSLRSSELSVFVSCVVPPLDGVYITTL